MSIDGGAWGAGIATFSGERVLEVFYPSPALGAHDEPGTRELNTEDAEHHGLPSAQRTDDRRGTRQAPVITVIEDLGEPPAGTADAYLRLHLLSHRLVKPHDVNLDGLFGVLPNVAWTSAGPVDPAQLTQVQLRFRRDSVPLQVFSLDKFPRMTDYVTPSGVRVADADRVRLGAYLAEGTTVMHEGFVNFNAGTLGQSMVEGRISAGVVVGDGSDIGGGSSIMGTLSGGGSEVISIGERCLLGANAGLGHLARGRLHGRGRALRHRRNARHAARRRRAEGARAQWRERAAVPAQLADRHGRSAAALRHVVRAQRGAARKRVTSSAARAQSSIVGTSASRR